MTRYIFGYVRRSLSRSRSAPKLLLEEAIKTSRNQEIKTPRQDNAEKYLLSFALLACLLAWMDLAWKDELEAMLGLDRKIQFRIVNETPQGVRKVQDIQFNTRHSYLCSINPYT